MDKELKKLIDKKDKEKLATILGKETVKKDGKTTNTTVRK